MRYLALVLLLLVTSAASSARAQDSAILARGDALVTGFSGTKPADPATVAGDPLDETFIDPDGASAQILRLKPGAPPAGQLITASPALRVKARDVGQVFAIGVDDSLRPDRAHGTPNSYLGATSAFGLQIVAPDSDGDGRPERLRKGHAKAEWMPGQFGKNGEPGSIYRIDGKTGAISLFATIPGNRGPGLGDIVFDPATRQFFVSDLDTGLIHRLDATGTLIDTFDHGQTGRPAMGLPAVADDGVVMDIKSPAFDSEDSATWGFTQPERRVWGLALRAGRLYYAPVAGPEIWSVSIDLDGTFGSDPRREIEVSGTPTNHPISDIAFDAQDHMYVAQRGGIKGSYDYSVFADAKQSVVFRFGREMPDDPDTPGIWVPIPDEYAVGYPPDYRNTSGGLALGYGYDAAGAIRPGACDMTIWATGDALLSNASPTQEAAAQQSPSVNGLQGTDRVLSRPDNEPPAKSFFLDYDGVTDDPRQQGHVGDVEIWQPCEPGADFGTYAPAADLPPDYVPPGETPEDDVPLDGVPSDDVPPDGFPEGAYNLRLEKRPLPGACVAGGLGFLCDYVVRVTNTGPDAYVGPIVVNDELPAAPAGAVMTPANIPPWLCFAISPTEQQCTYGAAGLLPGESIDLHMTVDLPVAAPVCHLDNEAGLVWPLGLGDADAGDDFDLATATIPAPHCPPPDGEKTNLKISKHPLADVCTDKIGHFECRYNIVVRNIGAGVYDGPIEVDDTIPAGATASFAPASWNCAGPAPTYTCQRGPVVLLPGQAVNLNAVVKVPKNLAGPLQCQAKNEAKIVAAAGGTDQNTDPTDDEADATMLLPGEIAQCPGLPKLSNLKLKKSGPNGECPVVFGNWLCEFKVTVQNFGKAYTNPIQFIDALPFGNPAGATLLFQPPAGWNCGGPVLFPNLYQCSSDNPDLAHLEKVEIPVTVKIPVAPVAKCEVTNNAQIVKAPGGTLINSFAGDDKSSAKAQLSAAVAQGICLSNLKLTKTGPAEPCPVAGNSWECKFKVTVQNFGKDYKSPIQFVDGLPGMPAGATVSFQPPAGWNCGGPALFPNLYQCSSNNPDLAHQEKVEIPVTVKIPVAPVAKCEITNNAKIVKALGGTAHNFFKADDEDSAKAQLATVFPLGGGQGICVTTNLKLDQIVKNPNLGGVCPVEGGHWACHFGLKVTNVGEHAYAGEMQIADGLFGPPAGARISFDEPQGWDCGSLHPNLYQCRSKNAKLGKGESVIIPGTVRIPLGPVEKCEVTNNAEIVKARGGSPLNIIKGDDKASVAMPLQKDVVLPNGLVACLSKKSNLKIEKTSWVPGNDLCQVSGNIWLCDWRVKITNLGDTYTLPLAFTDSLEGIQPAGASVMLGQPTGWTCNQLAQDRASCRNENPNLKTGESVEFAATVRVPLGPVATCTVKNHVRIGLLDGAPNLDFDNPGFSSSSTMTLDVYLPPSFPDVPYICYSPAVGKPELPLATPEGKESNLTITKTADASQVTATGQNTKFTITVTNEGPGVFNAPIEVRDTLFDGAIVEPSNGSWSAPWVCEGQSAVGHPEQGICKHPLVELDPGESVVLDLEIEAPNSFVAPSGSAVKCGYENKVEILRPAGGSPKNADAGDDTASAEVKFAPFEKHGTTFCGLGLTTPPAVCPQGWSRTPIAGKCCPPRSTWDGERCKRDVKQPEEKCPANSVGDHPNCRCKPGYAGTPPNCREIDVDVPERCTGGMELISGECRCPRGTRFLDGKCRTPSSEPEKTCGVNEVGTYPNCRCSRGFTGSPPNCKPIACPANQQWVDGACRCRSPLKWNGKRCVADTPKTCPADSVGNYPNCRCKRGTTGVPGKCERIVEPKKCPADSVGKYPNCRCKRGTTGTPGDCRRIVEPKTCPKGFRGTPPNCKRIIIEPRKCPEGFRGTPPNCKRIIIEPRKCPEGFRGKPPNCKRIGGPRRQCPEGFRGRPPNCKRIGTNPL